MGYACCGDDLADSRPGQSNGSLRVTGADDAKSYRLLYVESLGAEWPSNTINGWTDQDILAA